MHALSEQVNLQFAHCMHMKLCYIHTSVIFIHQCLLVCVCVSVCGIGACVGTFIDVNTYEYIIYDKVVT